MGGREWLVLARRYLAVGALLFWVGGFTFYAGVVVPVGTAVLGSAQAQGAITRQVTVYLNLAGGVALVLLMVDVAGTRGEGRPGRWGRWLACAGMAVILLVLVGLHGWLVGFIDPETGELTQRRVFRGGHRWYLWLSTVQWMLALVYLGLMLAAWRREDRAGFERR